MYRVDSSPSRVNKGLTHFVSLLSEKPCTPSLDVVLILEQTGWLAQQHNPLVENQPAVQVMVLPPVCDLPLDYQSNE